ncbi:MAG: hypothetical protein KDJ43_05690, partial [Rhizobiaceae bacterium]|nr:hypothetical protein [Rhizobiaceae bacterium]
ALPTELHPQPTRKRAILVLCRGLIGIQGRHRRTIQFFTPALFLVGPVFTGFMDVPDFHRPAKALRLGLDVEMAASSRDPLPSTP